MQKIKPEILSQLKKYEKYIQSIEVTEEGFKFRYYKKDSETNLSLYFNIVIRRPISFYNMQKKDSETNVCNKILFEYRNLHKRNTLRSYKDIFELSCVELWPVNCSEDRTGYNRETIIVHFNNFAMYSEKFICNTKKINSDFQFSYHYVTIPDLKDRETIQEFTLG